MTINRDKKSGFTLVEMIVSLGIFSVVAVIALGALVKIISANKKAQAIQSAFTNLNFALESMSRELRVGSTYRCDSTTGDYHDNDALAAQACSVNNNAVASYPLVSIIAFKSPRVGVDLSGNPCNLINVYRFVSTPGPNSRLYLQKAEQPRCGENVSVSDTPGDQETPNNLMFSNIISMDNMTLTDYRLGVTDGAYPRVFIRLKGYAGTRQKEKTDFDIQTEVSQRVMD